MKHGLEKKTELDMHLPAYRILTCLIISFTKLQFGVKHGMIGHEPFEVVTCMLMFVLKVSCLLLKCEWNYGCEYFTLKQILLTVNFAHLSANQTFIVK